MIYHNLYNQTENENRDQKAEIEILKAQLNRSSGRQGRLTASRAVELILVESSDESSPESQSMLAPPPSYSMIQDPSTSGIRNIPNPSSPMISPALPVIDSSSEEENSAPLAALIQPSTSLRASTRKKVPRISNSKEASSSRRVQKSYATRKPTQWKCFTCTGNKKRAKTFETKEDLRTHIKERHYIMYHNQTQ